MYGLYLTPASIGYLTQFILALAITTFLARRLRKGNRPLILLTYFFAGVTGFIGLLFLDAALLPFPRLLAVYAENTALALASVFLLMFAYRFPRPFPQHKWESRAGLAVSLAYLLWEGSYMIYRYVSLLARETVYYRPFISDYANALVLLWVPVAFLRQSIAADPRPVSGLVKLWKPQGKGARGARNFVFVFGIVFVLGAINVLRSYAIVSTTLYNITLSVGILAALWLFVSIYINFIPGGVSMLARLSILTLTLFLALLGSVGWLIAPPYIATYRPDLTDHQTLRFTPNGSGGYEVASISFAFETELGDRLAVDTRNEARNHRVDFVFPFYGQSYTEIYVASSGVVSMGQPFWQPNMQARSINTPIIFPLMLDLNPKAGGGLYARRDADRLILTWDQVPAQFRPGSVFTFQTVLYTDGVFDVTYNGLPLPFRFDPDETPSANPWLRGATPGRGEDLHTRMDDLSAPQEGQLAIVQNYYHDFRRYLHAFILPLSWVAMGGSLLLLLILPTLLHLSLVKPLDALLAGVRDMEAGNLDVQVAVQNEDEIGYLTQAFNHMAAQLGGLMASLEERVAWRTEELAQANEQLRAEMAARERDQAQIVEQQRQLAILEERTRLSRDLHDGLGQVLVYIGVQAQAIKSMLQRGNVPPALDNLEELGQASRQAVADLRDQLVGLRAPEEGKKEEKKEESTAIPSRPQTLAGALPAILEQFQARHGLEVHLWPPALPDEPLLPTNVEEQAMRIIQEALTNVAKHAQARRVNLDVQIAIDRVQITITDDGIGFEPPDPGAETAEDGAIGRDRYGLTIMQERAEQAGGRLAIDAAPGKGSRVTVTLPRLLPPGEEEDVAEVRGLRVVLADDHPLFLDGMRNLLVARGVTVVATAQDGTEAVEKVRALHPDVAVLDLNMPGLNGIEATRVIKAEIPEVQVVILTVPESEDHLYEAIRSGASGYLYKDLEANQFCQLLAGLLRGEAALSPGIAERLIAEFVRPIPAPEEETEADPLSPRQREILGMVSQGLTYKEVGQRLHLSDNTIKYHMGQVLEKLHVESRAQAIAHHVERSQPPTIPPGGGKGGKGGNR